MFFINKIKTLLSETTVPYLPQLFHKISIKGHPGHLRSQLFTF